MDSAKAGPVTIIIPAFLRTVQDIDWLDEAFSSAFNQSMLTRCAIVENGSNFLPDFVGNIVTVMHSEKGLSKARNAGIRSISTEYFFPLDCNDWLPENAIEVAVKRMPESGFLYGSTMLFSGKRGLGDQHFYEARPYDFAEVMKMVYFPNGALQRKSDWEKIGGYREDLPFLEDWDYWMTAGELGICGTPIQDTLYWYRQHGGIVQTNNHTPQWEETKKVIQKLHENIYKGVYPPMCCGKTNKVLSRTSTPTNNSAPAGQSDLPGVDGMMVIEYLGANAGDMTWYGPVTNTRYKVGGIHRQIYIDINDAETGSRKNPGFLEIQENGKNLFQRVN